MTTIKIDSEKCVGCKECVKACPMLLWQMNAEGKSEPLEGAGEYCVDCGHCEAICPVCAISINGRKAEDFDTVSELPDLATFTNLVKSRRSIRAFKSDTVAKDKISELIDLTRWAPTAKNCQPLKWTVIQSADKVRELAGMCMNFFRKAELMPEIYPIWDSGIDIINRGAPHLVITHTAEDAMLPVIDTTIAMTTFNLAATASGLGACWAGFFMIGIQNDPAIAAACGIPSEDKVQTAMMLGHAELNYKKIPERNEAVVNWQ